MINRKYEMFYNKLTQSVTAFTGSFIASIPDLPQHLTDIDLLDQILKVGQILSVWFLMGIGLVKFYHYLKDRHEKNDKK